MKQKIIVPQVQVQKRPIKGDLFYSYTDGVLRLYNKDSQKLWENRAQPGEIYIVNHEKNEIYVDEVKFPKTKNHIVAFLIGCGRKYRVRSKQMCDQWAEESRKKHFCPGYHERVIEGDRYKIFQWCNGDEEYLTMCCYIADNVNKEDVLKLIPIMVYPYGFTQKALADNFGITAEEFDEAAMAEI